MNNINFENDEPQSSQIIYEWRTPQGCVVIYRVADPRSMAYVQVVISDGAFAPMTPPAKAIHFPQFIQAWREAVRVLDAAGQSERMAA